MKEERRVKKKTRISGRPELLFSTRAHSLDVAEGQFGGIVQGWINKVEERRNKRKGIRGKGRGGGIEGPY